jgi:hypothetical protein
MQNCTGSTHASVSSIESATRTSARNGIGVGIVVELPVRGSYGSGGVCRPETSVWFKSMLISIGRLFFISSTTSCSLSQLSIRMRRPQFRLPSGRPKSFLLTLVPPSSCELQSYFSARQEVAFAGQPNT